MLFPLTRRKLIRGFQAHLDDGLGGACDYEAKNDILYAPYGGYIYKFQTTEGGLWIGIRRENGEKIEFAHLSEYLINKSFCKEGEVLAMTGNTGTRTTNPHLHLQVFNEIGERIDPEEFFHEKNIPVVAVNANIPFMQELQKKILEYTQGLITISWDLLEHPLEIKKDQLTQDMAYTLSESLYRDDLKPFRHLFIFYKGNTTSAFLSTFYHPLQDNCITLSPVLEAKACAWEFSLQLIKYYNVHRKDNPYIEINDIYKITDEDIIRNYRSVLPYDWILLKKN